ncbi:MAG: hypothetical protein C4523_12540 [Myxococcales bacterium]|nr:MAG: hypothetical protein C4523_12540 [Myxococcales bacterium]
MTGDPAMRSKTLSLLFGLSVLALMASASVNAQQTDKVLNADFFYKVDGLDGLNGECCYDAAGDTSCGDEETPGSCVSSSGEIGVSQFITNDKNIVMAGSIQPTFDDGRSCSCAREVQTYTIVDRTGQAFPGLTNTLIALCLCANPTGDCDCVRRWSTQYAGPLLPEGGLEAVTDVDKDLVGILFPDTIGDAMQLHAQSPTGSRIDTRHMAVLDTGDPETDDIVIITQSVYQPPGKPYFDITWKMETQKENATLYRRAKFWHVVDTYTAGNDFGYGYLCDVAKISGGTGGASFFQGTLAMHPSAKQYEGWWAAVFDKTKRDDLPTFTWSNPLGPDALTAGVALTRLDDNAIAQEWDNLTLGVRPIYVSARWTLDDPILQSTYGSVRSLFSVASNDVEYLDEVGDKVKVTPSLYDVNFNPRYWRGAIYGYRLPTACKTNSDCTDDDRCLPAPECKGPPVADKCPHYCAVDYYTPSVGCSSGKGNLFGFCVTRKWKTENIDNYLAPASGRKIFTFNTSGARLWFEASNADALNAQFGFDSAAEAADLISWTTGVLNENSDAGNPLQSRKVIPSNASTLYDLHRPLNPDALALATPVTIELLRERYDEIYNDSWLLGDIAHADPIYLGSKPSNSWADVGPVLYSKFFNAKDYQRRRPTLLVAANDGMLHCFDGESGVELWAFVPWDILPKLREIARPVYEQLRSPAMDLRPVVHDAFNKTTNEWRSVLLVGSRGGGDHYWALDITPPYGHLTPTQSDPDRAEFLWYFTDPDLGLTYSVPTSGRFRTTKDPDDTDSEWMAFFGSGYAPHSAAQIQKEGYFYAVKMFPASGQKTPTLVAKVRISKNSGDDPPYNIAIAGLGDDETFVRNNVLSSGTVMDNGQFRNAAWTTEQDGYEDAVYIGDLAGHLLRFAVIPDTAGSHNFHLEGQVLFNTFRVLETPDELYNYKQRVANTRLQQLLGEDDASTYYEFYKYPRPISVRPVVWRTDTNPNDEGQTDKTFLGEVDNFDRTMVFVGTGKYDAFHDSFDEFKRQPNAAACLTWPYSGCTIDQQQFIGVIDWNYPTASEASRVKWAELMSSQVQDTTAGGSSLEVGDRPVRLIDRMGNNPETGWRGWKLAFNSTLEINRGEKVVTEPVIMEQADPDTEAENRQANEWIAFFTTFTPNMQGTCDIRAVNEAGKGGGYVMSIRAQDGQAPNFAIQDIDGDLVLNASDKNSGKGYAGQKFAGSILSRVEVDPYTNSLYVKTGADQGVLRIQIAGLPPMQGAKTTFFRIR